MGKTIGVLVTLLALAGASVARADKDRRKSQEEKQRERIEELSRKLARRLKTPEPGEENKFLHARASALLERAKQARQDAYLFDRLSRAADDLLEASESIFEAGEPERDPEDDDREEAARALQRYYFRAQQAEYFAGLSKPVLSAPASSPEAEPDLYVKYARSLYQQGRSAYDGQRYRRAKKLGEASAKVVSALENLAQASVRAPEPPRLE